MSRGFHICCIIRRCPRQLSVLAGGLWFKSTLGRPRFQSASYIISCQTGISLISKISRFIVVSLSMVKILYHDGPIVVILHSWSVVWRRNDLCCCTATFTATQLFAMWYCMDVTKPRRRLVTTQVTNGVAKCCIIVCIALVVQCKIHIRAMTHYEYSLRVLDCAMLNIINLRLVFLCLYRGDSGRKWRFWGRRIG